jgi:hypothetical protein
MAGEQPKVNAGVGGREGGGKPTSRPVSIAVGVGAFDATVKASAFAYTHGLAGRIQSDGGVGRVVGGRVGSVGGDGVRTRDNIGVSTIKPPSKPHVPFREPEKRGVCGGCANPVYSNQDRTFSKEVRCLVLNKLSLSDAIGSYNCWIEANMRVFP